MVRQTINYVMMLLSILMIGETFHYSSEDKIFVYAEALAPSGIVTYLPHTHSDGFADRSEFFHGIVEETTASSNNSMSSIYQIISF